MKTVVNNIFLSLLITTSFNYTFGQQSEKKLQTEILTQFEIDYLIYLPDGYAESSNEWPLLLFLHGVGERGNDLNIVKRNGPPKLIEEGKKFPFIIVSPQCAERTDWDNRTLIVLLDFLESKYNIDNNRIYLTGLSMGGHATWSLAIQYPKRFAAIAPVCGRGYSQDALALKELPVWVFHGEKDDIVPIKDGKKMVKALEDCGANVKFTVYPEAGHDAWTETYKNPELYNWFLNFRSEN
jgi:predicted peptidase